MAEINGKGHYDWCGTAFSRGRRTAHSAGAETTYFSGHFKGVDARNSAADWDHFGLTSADSASSGGSRSVWKSSQSVWRNHAYGFLRHRRPNGGATRWAARRFTRSD
jgi:hypothetical protein